MTTTETEPMPIETAAGARFAVLPVKQLVPHAKNVRVEVGDVSDLAASIKAQGVLQPLVVAPAAKKKDRWVVIAGHRRLAGAKVARLAEVPCMVRDDLTGEVDQLQEMLVENGHRVDLTPVEEGDAYRALTLDYGVPLKDLAAKVGRSAATVKGRITLATSPESVRTRVIAGQVPMEQAIALAEFEDDEDEHKGLEQYLGTSHWAWALQCAKDARAAARQWAKGARDAEKSGARRVDVRPDGELVAELADLADEAAEAAGDAVLAAHTDEAGVLDDEGEQAAVTAAEEARAAFTVEAHTSCPGHCVHVASPYRDQWGSQRRGLVLWACDQPALHDNATGRQTPTGSPGETAATAVEEAKAAEEARARHEQRLAALAAAAKVRRRHLGTNAQKTTEKEARAYLARRVANESTRPGHQVTTWPIADVLGITLPDPRPTGGARGWQEAEAISNEDHAARQDIVREAIAGWGVAELVGLLALTSGLPHDIYLDRADPYFWERSTTWLRQVAATGHEWSPAEVEFLPDGVLERTADEGGES